MTRMKEFLFLGIAYALLGQPLVAADHSPKRQAIEKLEKEDKLKQIKQERIYKQQREAVAMASVLLNEILEMDASSQCSGRVEAPPSCQLDENAYSKEDMRKAVHYIEMLIDQRKNKSFIGIGTDVRKQIQVWTSGNSHSAGSYIGSDGLHGYLSKRRADVLFQAVSEIVSLAAALEEK